MRVSAVCAAAFAIAMVDARPAEACAGPVASPYVVLPARDMTVVPVNAQLAVRSNARLDAGRFSELVLEREEADGGYAGLTFSVRPVEWQDVAVSSARLVPDRV